MIIKNIKELDGYVLGINSNKMYAVITDNVKSYQLDCEYELLGLDEKDIIAERKFKMIVDENEEVTFKFLDEYINKDITIEKLKNFKGIK